MPTSFPGLSLEVGKGKALGIDANDYANYC